MSGGTASGTTVSAGGDQSVHSGGTADSATLISGNQFLYSGVASVATLVSSSKEYVESPSSAVSVTVQDGSEQFVNGGTAIDSFVSSGGTMKVYGGGVASGATVFASASAVVSASGTTSDTTVSSGGFETVQNGGSAVSTTVNSGGLLSVFSGGTAVDTMMTSGAALDLASVAYSGGAAASVNSTTDVLTVSVGGQTYTEQLAGTYTGATFAVTSASDGSVLVTDTTPCFCRGTQILTVRGEVAVEDLAVGDTVVTASGATAPITWIGFGRTLVTPAHRSAATPILVCKDALADNVPNRDLRITKGHSLFVDGVLIPAEFLINHRSIRWDDHAQVVEFYHIELATHDVLLADGAPAESYRDDGNRDLFQNARTGRAQPAKAPCAPVLTGGPVVDAAWRRLLDRAGPRPGLPLTDDPDLHLLADGERVDVRSHQGGWYTFDLIRCPQELRVISRAGSPEELGLARDPRVLGVAVRQIRLWQGPRLRVLEAADPTLTHGFHAFEPDEDIRWTNGDAELPATLFADLTGACQVELLLSGATQYPMFAEAAEKAAA